MKVNNITIILADNKDKRFTLEQNDWEGAPDPICMSLITEDSWRKVADELEKSMNEAYSQDLDEDELDEIFWSEYERFVIKHCKCFYYEDMTDDEYNAYKSASDVDKRRSVLERAYARIKAEEN